MTIKKILCTICLLLALPCSAVFAQGRHSGKPAKAKKADTVKAIHWVQGKESDFEDSVRKLKKPAFLYIYIDSWEEVQKFNDSVLTDTSVISYVNKHFMAYKLNMEFDYQDAMKFMIDGVPAVILLNGNAGELARLQDYHTAQDFIKFLSQAAK